VAHQHLPHLASWRLPRVLAVLGLVVVSSASTCLDDVDPPECEANCDIEDECGFRTLAECEAAACNRLTGEAENPGLAACLGAAGDCLEAAACACDDGCEKLDACTGSPDPECVSTCDTLVEQDGEATYRENVCRIESSCEDLAACSSVSG
jgi:hypothetical protein